MTQFIGGMYADINGGKSILANGMLASSLAAIVLPLTAQFFGSTGTLILRYIAGMTGVSWFFKFAGLCIHRSMKVVMKAIFI